MPGGAELQDGARRGDRDLPVEGSLGRQEAEAELEQGRLEID